MRSPSLTHFISFAPEHIYPLSPSCSPTASIMSGWLRAFTAPLFLDAAAQQMFKSPLPSVPPQNHPNLTTSTSSAHLSHHLLSRQPLAAQEPGLGHAPYPRHQGSAQPESLSRSMRGLWHPTSRGCRSQVPALCDRFGFGFKPFLSWLPR